MNDDDDDAEALGRPWGAQVAKGVVEGPSKVPNRRMGDPVRRTAAAMGPVGVERGGRQTDWQGLVDFDLRGAGKAVADVEDRGAPNATYTVVSWTWAPFLKPCHD